LLAVAVALAGGFVAVAPRLVQLGLSAPLFYVVLVPLGLASATVLYQVLAAASAQVQAKFWFGTVKLGGPVAVFALVVGGGIYVFQHGGAPPVGPVTLVVRVPAELRDVDLTRATDLVVLMGQRRFPPDLVIPTEAHFPLASDAKEHPLELVGRIPGYDLEGGRFTYPADGVQVLAATRQRSVVEGTLDGPAEVVAGATIVFEGGLVEVRPDRGEFRAVLPRPPGTLVRVEARYQGKLGARAEVTTPGKITLSWSASP
jgi:hypothetical protein